ncbi:MAG: hypothetical protein HZT40_22515 [Candidatus Thiothrix singaporensis]|uniref:Uncharacterized protein n=1 Tax=Candidatus Thiothrix singaporensis TaxID=2799669 RepID=A0A7L6AY03_9GAMM|nr:MAG: hypothetical protein HZT40_22515 [Candidatus Thiothrix singaporensis]
MTHKVKSLPGRNPGRLRVIHFSQQADDMNISKSIGETLDSLRAEMMGKIGHAPKQSRPPASWNGSTRPSVAIRRAGTSAI